MEPSAPRAEATPTACGCRGTNAAPRFILILLVQFFGSQWPHCRGRSNARIGKAGTDAIGSG